MKSIKYLKVFSFILVLPQLASAAIQRPEGTFRCSGFGGTPPIVVTLTQNPLFLSFEAPEAIVRSVPVEIYFRKTQELEYWIEAGTRPGGKLSFQSDKLDRPVFFYSFSPNLGEIPCVRD